MTRLESSWGSQIVVCADDYGLNAPVSEGILELIEANGLTATSCLVNFPDWPYWAARLKPWLGNVQVGLHFNLTEGVPLTALPATHVGGLKKLLLRAHLRRLNQAAVEAELVAQLQVFHQALGRWPDFIDGHEHVHHLPVIRDALLAVYQRTFRESRPWIRVASNPFSAILGRYFGFKKLIIALSGARALRHLLVRHAIVHNPRFSGIYDFSKAAQYATFFQSFLREVAGGGLIMCHPGEAGDTGDVIKAARPLELAFLLTRARQRASAAQDLKK